MVAQLGVAGPEKLAEIVDEGLLVAEFTLFDKYVNRAADPTVALVGTWVYLTQALGASGTSDAEIARFARDLSGYQRYVTRFNGPALEGLTGTRPSGSGLETRHDFIAVRSFTVQAYRKTERYRVTETIDPTSIRIRSGSYATGQIVADFTVILRDNIETTYARLNDPSMKSLNGNDLVTGTFTRNGDRWTVATTGSYQAGI